MPANAFDHSFSFLFLLNSNEFFSLSFGFFPMASPTIFGTTVFVSYFFLPLLSCSALFFRFNNNALLSFLVDCVLVCVNAQREMGEYIKATELLFKNNIFSCAHKTSDEDGSKFMVFVFLFVSSVHSFVIK